MRIVDSDSTCKPGEYALAWSIAGVQGPVGEQGEQGEQGSGGEQGVAGVDASPNVYDGDGNLLGSLLSEFHGPSVDSQTKPRGYTILSTEGYIFPLNTSAGTVYDGQSYNGNYSGYIGYGLRRGKVVYYGDQDCMGQAYVRGSITSNSSNHSSDLPAKTAFYNYDAKSLWYSGSETFNASEIDIYQKGLPDPNSCYGPISVYPINNIVYLEVFPNNESETGIPNGPVALPIFYE